MGTPGCRGEIDIPKVGTDDADSVSAWKTARPVIDFLQGRDGNFTGKESNGLVHLAEDT